MMEHDSHLGFIIAAYVVAAVVIGTMIIATLVDYRSLKKRLAPFGERGLDRE